MTNAAPITRAQEPVAAAPNLLDKIIEQQAAVASRYKPVMSTIEMVEREKAIQYLVDNIMREGIDYGWIPGTRPKEDAKPGEYQAKPTLFKAGAERACAFFGYVPEYEALKIIEEWTAEKFGEMLFYYSYRCTLLKDTHAVGSGLASASTWESKYRYRNSERTCPQCGKPNIRKSKSKPGHRGEPGFYCWDKTGGCGSTFEANDTAITQQEVGKMPNPDIADVINTVQKMGQKRAYVAATLTATGLSGRFTQDLEDLPAPRETQRAPEEPRPAATDIPRNGAPEGREPSPEVQRADTDLEAHLKRMGAGFKEAVAELEWAKGELNALTEGDVHYYAILDRFKMAHANQFKTLQNGRACFSALYREIGRIREEISALAEQQPEVQA